MISSIINSKLICFAFVILSSGFINGAALYDKSSGKKAVALMMFAAAGLFIVNALIEVILLKKVSVASVSETCFHHKIAKWLYLELPIVIIV